MIVLFRIPVLFPILSLVLLPALYAADHRSERLYLSGHGPKDAVAWGFTVTGGRRAGEATSIPVPSNWEQHGFGTYSYGLAPTPRSEEHGLYRRTFVVPVAWRGRRVRLFFDGVMTDASVTLNGRLTGPTHRGAFYRFSYDVTALLKYGPEQENVLEVDVAKASGDKATDAAERGGDYWVFGGIFRPVWLEAYPEQAITHVAITATADGRFTAAVDLSAVTDATSVEVNLSSADGEVGEHTFTTAIPAGGSGVVHVNGRVDQPRLWTAETPNLYIAQFNLRTRDQVLHTVTQRFGFRTFEVRAGEGLFLNGQRVLLKGVNRHSFRPDTARALDPESCIEDARLIRSMNMNAVRMSHYPPDEAFLEACDELGLYVLDELSGWHHAHETETGRRLVREMVERDVNHPCILFWDNGNEGGWNHELDGEFARYDPQQRRVILPSDTHDDLDTKHYPSYEELTQKLAGRTLVLPTEFMHALYDGGGGAGLEDYWHAIANSRLGCGGFIWALFDEGIARTDRGGKIDVFASYAPDGLVGPRHEREGSYYAVRDIWCPVQIARPTLDDRFSGRLSVSNQFDFTSLQHCRFTWKLVRFSRPEDSQIAAHTVCEGAVPGPEIAPHARGTLSLPLPPGWQDADGLSVTVQDSNGAELWSWTWPVVKVTESAATAAPASARAGQVAGGSSPSGEGTGDPAVEPKIEVTDGEIHLSTGNLNVGLDATTGLLRSVRHGERSFALSHGPRLVFARPAAAGSTTWLEFANEDAGAHTYRVPAPQTANTLEVRLDYAKDDAWAGFKLEICSDATDWKTIYQGVRRGGDGTAFNFPPQTVRAVRLSSVTRASGQPIAVKSVRLGYDAARFPSEPSPAVVTYAVDKERRLAWVESRGGGSLGRIRWTLDGHSSLQLEYEYELEGEFLYHGVTFDQPENSLSSVRWLGDGPYRVWQNRRRGSWLGVHENNYHQNQPGESWNYPEFQGYFGGLRWARLQTKAGSFTVHSASPEVYLRVGTPRIDHVMTTVDFPAGDLSFLHAIPAIGSKFITAAHSGPSGMPTKASGPYRGRLTLHFN